MSAVLDVRTYWRMHPNLRDALHSWADDQGVPIKAPHMTFALAFDEGRVTVHQYAQPLRLNDGRTGAVEADPFDVAVAHPPPVEVLRWALAGGSDDLEGVPTMGVGQPSDERSGDA